MRVEEAWKRARADEGGPLAVAGDALLGELYAARGLLKGARFAAARDAEVLREELRDALRELAICREGVPA